MQGTDVIMRGPIGTRILRRVEVYLVRISCLVQFCAMSRRAPAHTLIMPHVARLLDRQHPYGDLGKSGQDCHPHCEVTAKNA